MYSIKRSSEQQARAHRAQLIDLLEDSVNHGASIGFLRPLDRSRGEDYWNEVFVAVGVGSKILLIATIGEQIVGSVQLDLCQKQNGSHRAEIQKLMVLSQHRRKGIAAALMQAIESEARELHRTLLFLDTEQHSPGEPFYESQHWIRCGSIPDYALSADGVPTPNLIYYKRFATEGSPTARR